jgi:hypothetical protein
MPLPIPPLSPLPPLPPLPSPVQRQSSSEGPYSLSLDDIENESASDEEIPSPKMLGPSMTLIKLTLNNLSYTYRYPKVLTRDDYHNRVTKLSSKNKEDRELIEALERIKQALLSRNYSISLSLENLEKKITVLNTTTLCRYYILELLHATWLRQ